MRLAALILAAASPAFAEDAGGPSGRLIPVYTPSSIVHAATGQTGPLAPNTIASIYGSGLAWVSRSLQPGDIKGDTLPTLLPGTGLRVLVGGIPAPLYYVSPRQVNFLLPSNLVAEPVEIRLVLDGAAGPEVRIEIRDAAPGLFLQDEALAVATRADGSLVTSAAPARPGEVVILYATGLGAVTPPVRPGEVVDRAAALARPAGFRVHLDGRPVDNALVAYAGLAPGFSGLYQVNLLRLPDSCFSPGGAPRVEVRLEADGRLSPEGVYLAVAR